MAGNSKCDSLFIAFATEENTPVRTSAVGYKQNQAGSSLISKMDKADLRARSGFKGTSHNSSNVNRYYRVRIRTCAEYPGLPFRRGEVGLPFSCVRYPKKMLLLYGKEVDLMRKVC